MKEGGKNYEIKEKSGTVISCKSGFVRSSGKRFRKNRHTGAGEKAVYESQLSEKLTGEDGTYGDSERGGDVGFYSSDITDQSVVLDWSRNNLADQIDEFEDYELKEYRLEIDNETYSFSLDETSCELTGLEADTDYTAWLYLIYELEDDTEESSVYTTCHFTTMENGYEASDPYEQTTEKDTEEETEIKTTEDKKTSQEKTTREITEEPTSEDPFVETDGDVKVSNLTDTSVRLSWSKKDLEKKIEEYYPDYQLTGYELQVRLMDDWFGEDGSVINLAENATSYTVTGLEPDTEYFANIILRYTSDLLYEQTGDEESLETIYVSFQTKEAGEGSDSGKTTESRTEGLTTEEKENPAKTTTEEKEQPAEIPTEEKEQSDIPEPVESIEEVLKRPGSIFSDGMLDVRKMTDTSAEFIWSERNIMQELSKDYEDCVVTDCFLYYCPWDENNEMDQENENTVDADIKAENYVLKNLQPDTIYTVLLGVVCSSETAEMESGSDEPLLLNLKAIIRTYKSGQVTGESGNTEEDTKTTERPVPADRTEEDIKTTERPVPADRTEEDIKTTERPVTGSTETSATEVPATEAPAERPVIESVEDINNPNALNSLETYGSITSDSWGDVGFFASDVTSSSVKLDWSASEIEKTISIYPQYYTLKKYVVRLNNDEIVTEYSIGTKSCVITGLQSGYGYTAWLDLVYEVTTAEKGVEDWKVTTKCFFVSKEGQAVQTTELQPSTQAPQLQPSTQAPQYVPSTQQQYIAPQLSTPAIKEIAMDDTTIAVSAGCFDSYVEGAEFKVLDAKTGKVLRQSETTRDTIPFYNLKRDRIYAVQVRSYVHDSNYNKVYSNWSEKKYCIAQPKISASKKKSKIKKDKVTVKWNKITGASSYVVYARKHGAKKWIKVGTTKKTNYTFSKIKGKKINTDKNNYDITIVSKAKFKGKSLTSTRYLYSYTYYTYKW